MHFSTSTIVLLDKEENYFCLSRRKIIAIEVEVRRGLIRFVIRLLNFPVSREMSLANWWSKRREKGRGKEDLLGGHCSRLFS